MLNYVNGKSMLWLSIDICQIMTLINHKLLLHNDSFGVNLISLPFIMTKKVFVQHYPVLFFNGFCF